MSLLYCDTREFEPLIKRIDKAIRKFLPSKDKGYAAKALSALDELASIHVCFELVRLEWRKRSECEEGKISLEEFETWLKEL